MAKSLFLLLPMLMLIFLVVVPGDIHRVPMTKEANSCSELMGECRVDCFAKCSLKHPGSGIWSCKDSVDQTSVCVCSFPCGD